MNELSTQFLDQTGKEKLNGGGLTSRIEKNKNKKMKKERKEGNTGVS